MTGMSLVAAAALLVAVPAPTPAFAQAAPASADPAASPAPAPVDPAALPTARKIAARLLPAGIYKKILGPMMSPVMDNMGSMMKALPLRQLAEMGGLDAERAAALDQVDMAEVMAIYDPHWEERQKLSMQGMMGAMADFFTTVEPDLREAMAQAYARRFTTAELDDLDRFFATPSGTRFASEYMTVMTDPAVVEVTKAMMPRMMQQMPQFIAAAQEATAALPPPRRIEDLSAADKATLAEALGVDESTLQDPKTPL